MNTTTTRMNQDAGLTLVEIVIASVLGALLLGGIYSVVSSSTDTYSTEVVGTDLDRVAAKAIQTIADELSMSGEVAAFPRLSAPLSAAGVVLQKSEGWAGSSILWGPTTAITFDQDLNDPDDGLDNDGDGLVDEGLIVLRINPGAPNEQRVVLARHVREYLEGEVPNGVDDNGNGLVDERGLAISVVGDVWTIRLTVERRSSNGQVLTRTVETSVTPRN